MSCRGSPLFSFTAAWRIPPWLARESGCRGRHPSKWPGNPDRHSWPDIGTPGLDPVARNNVRSAQLQVRQGAYRIGEYDAAVIEDLLKFRGGLLATSCCKVRLTAHIDDIESSEFREQHCTGHREVVWNRAFQSLDRVQRRPSSECGKSVQRGKIFE